MHKILLGDDSRLTLAVEKAYLEARNLRVFATTVASEILPLARELQPDLIVIDYEMPDMRGDEVCLRLAEDTATAHIPVLMLSSHDNPDVRFRCEAAGAVGFASKAAGREALLDRVAGILGVAQRRHVRVDCHVTAGIVAAGASCRATLHNISVSGLYMTTREAFKEGEALRLRFKLPQSEVELHVLGEIARLETLGDGLCGYGVQFLEAEERFRVELEAFAGRTL